MSPANPAFLDVTVQFRTSPSGSTVYERTARLGSNGWTTVDVAAIPAGSYYIVVRHLNHLPVMTASPVALSDSSVASVDFTSVDAAWRSPAYSAAVQREDGGEWMLWSADFDGNGLVDRADDQTWQTDFTYCGTCVYPSTGYRMRSDADGNGHIDGVDASHMSAAYAQCAVSHVPGDVGRPVCVSVERASDTTRDVRLRWQYDGLVDIYVDDGDAGGYYDATFPGLPALANAACCEWVDTAASGHTGRYYRLMSSARGEWSPSTLMKYDYPFPATAFYSTYKEVIGLGLVPSSSSIDVLFGDQARCPEIGYWMIQKKYTIAPAYLSAEYSCSSGEWRDSGTGTPPPGFTAARGDAYWTVAPVVVSGSFTLAGEVPWDDMRISIPAFPVAGYFQFGTGLPTPVRVDSIVATGAIRGTSSTDATTISSISSVWSPGDGMYVMSLTPCWLESDSHWYTTGHVSCDSWQLLPNRGYWWSEPAGGGSYEAVIPKPYVSP
jgi:hypothetical protein